MRVKVNGEQCSGQGRCAKYDPVTYPLDDNGFNAQRGAEIEVRPGMEEAAIRGMKACPERAIKIIDS
jgi:ferredoxin